ncbi:hypothetical protein QBC35DRAFT_493046 [Podospora australis]|uniref:Uncharacterized protein n=1 Tax=Podospora australis TaxID=1536484 RepID=A0AAN7AI73_9PEZI|nr:hypothetical protein QBC35DRAFT_493046 [Podospora australis]
MPTSDDEPGYSLETSFYGPGALACWYLTILTARIITPLLVSSQRPNTSTVLASFELIASILFPVFAAGHLAWQISLFAKEDISSLTGNLVLLYDGGAKKLEEVIEPSLSPKAIKAIVGINAPFRICIAFLLIWVLSHLIMPLYTQSDQEAAPFLTSTDEPSSRWITHVVPTGWVVCCMIYMAVRCEFADASFLTTIFLAVYGLCLHSFSAWLLCLGIRGLYGLYSPLDNMKRCINLYLDRETDQWDWATRRPRPWLGHRTREVVFVVAGLLLHGAYMCGFGMMLGYLLWTFRFLWFPDVGVGLLALDQLFALATGIITIMYTTKDLIYKKWQGLPLLPSSLRNGQEAADTSLDA